jgi:hypothetical protein
MAQPTHPIATIFSDWVLKNPTFRLHHRKHSINHTWYRINSPHSGRYTTMWWINPSRGCADYEIADDSTSNGNLMEQVTLDFRKKACNNRTQYGCPCDGDSNMHEQYIKYYYRNQLSYLAEIIDKIFITALFDRKAGVSARFYDMFDDVYIQTTKRTLNGIRLLNDNTEVNPNVEMWYNSLVKRTQPMLDHFDKYIYHI